MRIAVVKKTFRYSNGFFYNRLYRNSLFRNFIMESGINDIANMTLFLSYGYLIFEFVSNFANGICGSHALWALTKAIP
jgi:hypothetical protein